MNRTQPILAIAGTGVESFEKKGAMSSQISTTRIATRFVVTTVVMSAFFFGSAGTLAWPEAWLYMVLQFTVSAAFTLWLKRYDPDLLKDRITFWKKSARGWDKAILLISTVIFVPYLLVPGLDAVRYHWSQVGYVVKSLGFVGILLSYAFIFRVMRENPYLSRVVEIQKERGHKVVRTGPYQYIRHPMYVGVIVLFFCIPLSLGSLWALIPGGLQAILIIVRTYLEDKTLHEELEGYKAYATEVRYKLVPGIW